MYVRIRSYALRGLNLSRLQPFISRVKNDPPGNTKFHQGSFVLVSVI